MALLGKGGTGKTHLLKAFRTYAASIGLEHAVLFTSTTASAAGLIGATTLHSLLKIPIKGRKPKRINSANAALAAAYVLVIDEVSMLARLLLRVDGPITFRYRGLPPNTIALPRTRPTSRKVPVKFSQFPVRPRKALTVHQSQGTTLAGGVIVDCSWGKRLAYVAISRAVALAKVTLLMPFKRSTVQTQTRPGPAHTRLHTRLTALHSATVAAVDAFASPFAAPLIL